jgi:hypothetical protein
VCQEEMEAAAMAMLVTRILTVPLQGLFVLTLVFVDLIQTTQLA